MKRTFLVKEIVPKNRVIIYKIVNVNTGYTYVGQTTNLLQRIGCHISASKPRTTNYIKKLGNPTYWKVCVLDTFINPKNTIKILGRESEWIAKLRKKLDYKLINVQG